MLIGSPMLAIKGVPIDHDTQICCLGPTLKYASIYHFSWIVYCGYTRPRSSLLSARLTQRWLRSLMERELYSGTHKKYPFWEFFTPALTDDSSVEETCGHSNSSFQNPSQHSGRSQQCCSLVGHHSSFYFQVLQSLYQSFGNWTEGTNYTWHQRHFHAP